MSARRLIEERSQEMRADQVCAPCGMSRDFLGNRFVYVVVSPPAHGLSIGLNLNPDRLCNFGCVYCEVNRESPLGELELDVSVMSGELERTLHLIHSVGIRHVPGYGELGGELARLRQVAFSGEGEPTLCARFAGAAQKVAQVRMRGFHPFFKMVLVTNGTCLDQPHVQAGLRYFGSTDEIWIKLDAGTQAYMDRVNRTEISLAKVMENAGGLGRERPIIIQSLFPLIAGQEPPPAEIDQYLHRLRELKEAGAMISTVRVYSANRPAAHPDSGDLPGESLASIGERIKTETGLNAEVF
jgi:wyosine [tRNA(Phe)-imidazoG37] synthetase (radical SAM superfamily)